MESINLQFYQQLKNKLNDSGIYKPNSIQFMNIDEMSIIFRAFYYDENYNLTTEILLDHSLDEILYE
jgi:hypothetical protein